MKKRILLAVAVLLVGIGVMKLFYSGPIEVFARTVSLGEKEEVPASSIDHLEIDTVPTDVTIEPVEGESIEILLDGEVSDNVDRDKLLKINENGNTLRVKVDFKTKNKVLFFLPTNTKTHLTIGLPEKQFESIKVDTVSGDIEVEEVETKRMDVYSVSGDLKTENLRVEGNLDIETVSGDIHSKQDEVGSFLFDSVSGDVSLQLDESIEPDFRFDSVSGDATIDLDEVDYQNKSEHDVIGKYKSGSTTIQVDTVSGDFQLR